MKARQVYYLTGFVSAHGGEGGTIRQINTSHCFHWKYNSLQASLCGKRVW